MRDKIAWKSMQKMVSKRSIRIKIYELLDCEKRMETNEVSDKWKKRNPQEHEFTRVDKQFFSSRITSQDYFNQFIEFAHISAVRDMFLQDTNLEKICIRPDCERNVLQ